MNQINSAEELALREASSMYDFYADDKNWQEEDDMDEETLLEMRGAYDNE